MLSCSYHNFFIGILILVSLQCHWECVKRNYRIITKIFIIICVPLQQNILKDTKMLLKPTTVGKTSFPQEQLSKFMRKLLLMFIQLHEPCLLLDLGQVLCRQPQLLWAHESNSPASSRRHCFILLLPAFWLLQPFFFLFQDSLCSSGGVWCGYPFRGLALLRHSFSTLWLVVSFCVNFVTHCTKKFLR